jgi:hypothetical protein
MSNGNRGWAGTDNLQWEQQTEVANELTDAKPKTRSSVDLLVRFIIIEREI